MSDEIKIVVIKSCPWCPYYIPWKENGYCTNDTFERDEKEREIKGVYLFPDWCELEHPMLLYWRAFEDGRFWSNSENPKEETRENLFKDEYWTHRRKNAMRFIGCEDGDLDE